MPDVTVHITDRGIIRALNTPGGAVFEWRDGVAARVVDIAQLSSPVNDPLNAAHRGGVVGTYKASWYWNAIGSNGHTVRANIGNRADHAVYVEEGRSPSTARQTFSWTQWRGQIRTVGGEAGRVAGSGTAGRVGRHILRDAVNEVVGEATGGAYTPLA